MGKNYIKRMIIDGFKKFEYLDVVFNESMNIIVGANEAGKSTILEALDLVVSQTYKNSDKSNLLDLFNRTQIDSFNEAPSVKTLPRIHIELELELDDKGRNSQWFLGEEYDKRFGEGDLRYGIKFTCEFDKELGADIVEMIGKGMFPLEYYVLRWETFGGKAYAIQRKALSLMSVNTTAHPNTGVFPRFTRNLFCSKINEQKALWHKTIFRDRVQKSIRELGLPKLAEEREFALDDKRLLLENVLAVIDRGIPLECRGSGMASLIKMRLILDKKDDAHSDVISIEEPENHLSYVSLRKMLETIEKERADSQIIIATHSNMIVSRLGVTNALWIDEQDNIVKSLNSVSERTAEYFKRLDNSGLLDFILATKVILVEGATEYLLLPMFYKIVNQRAMEEDGITVISCSGVSFFRYLQVGLNLHNKVAVITDNDGNSAKIKKIAEYNARNSSQQVFTGNSPEDWTWEKCLYDANKEKFDSILKLEEGAQYLYHGNDYGRELGYMLNHKTMVAEKILSENVELTPPAYVKAALEWIGK